MFDKATLRFSDNRTVILSREGPGIYVQRVTLNDSPYTSTWLPLGRIHSGTTRFHFVMGSDPNKQRGTDQQDRPPAFR
jgi:putative alpha-1,2-mannosidase